MYVVIHDRAWVLNYIQHVLFTCKHIQLTLVQVRTKPFFPQEKKFNDDVYDWKEKSICKYAT